ncbi:MAG: DNA polymerase III subunit [bacterium]|nr:DNA polymerase III subunit [bacterium]
MDSFLNVAGHENAKKLLSAALRNKKIAHSYLFIGVENLGKFLLAKEFAKNLSCQNGTFGNACGVCPRCLTIENETDPDVLFINSSKNKILDKDGEEKKSISIDEIRVLEHHLSLFPYNSKYKIAIINEAHKFTVEAVNAFLKTLEEPKGNSIIILVADDSKFLLKTLISRTQVIRFWPLKDETIENFLVSRKAPVQKAKTISAISSGKPGLAIEFLKNEQKIEDHYKKEEIFWNFFASNLSEKIIFLENLSKNEEKGENISDVLRFWLLCLRKKILEKYLSGGVANGAMQTEGGLKKTVDFINNLVIILNLINSSNINKRLALEILALEI